MVIYLITFFISIAFMKLAYNNDGISTQKVYGYLFLSILVLIILATLRGDHVGVDILVYQKDLYLHAARMKSLISFLKWSYEEAGYSLVTFIGAKFGHFAFVHFLNMSLILIPIYYLIWDIRDEIEPDMSLAAFLFLYYVQGYNMVRQQIAISLMALGLYLFSKKKNVPALVIGLISISFHYTAIVGFSSYFLLWMSRSKLKLLYQAVMISIVVWGMINFIALGRTAGQYIVSLLHISKISYRSSLGWFSKVSNLNETYVLFSSIGIAILLLCKICNKKPVERINRAFLFYMMFIMLVSTALTKNMGYVGRIFCYFEIWVVFVLPQILFFIHDDWKSRAIAKTVYLASLAAFWTAGVVIRGWNGVIPYYTFWQPYSH